MKKKLRSEKPENSNREILVYASVWMAAFILRAVYLWHLNNSPAFSLLLGDAATYDKWAVRIAKGEWLGEGVFYQAPLYPYFLGTLYSWFGRDLLLVRLVQIALGAGSCVLLARAGRSFFNRTTGLLAGFLLAVYPTAIFFDCSIQKSVLDLFFVCALLAVLGLLLERSRKIWWLMTGLLLGLLALTRENALLYLPLVLAWLFVAWRGERWNKQLQWAGLVLLGLAFIVLPVGFRNLLVGGEFHLTTAQLGPNFYIGNSKTATGFYQPLQEGRGNAMFEREDATTLAEKAAGRKLSPSEVSSYWTVRALDEIRADIPRWVQLVCRKWLLVWDISEVGDSDDQYTYSDWSPLLQILNPLLHFGTLCPLAALGICLTWNRRNHLLVLYALVLVYATTVALFYIFSRYRFPLVPMLILFAAAGLSFLRGTFREARWRTLAAGAATALLAAVVCNHATMPETLIRAGTHTNLGNAFAMEGRIQEAIEQYEQVLQLNPSDANVPLNLANTLMRAGRFEEAAGHYEQALRINPNNAHAQYNLGVSLARQGRPGEAVVHFEQALQIEPGYAEAHYTLGSVLFELGRNSEAIGHWNQALQINPAFAEVHYNLANAFLREGRLKEAIEHYEEALKNKPSYAQAHYNLGIALEQAGRLQAAIEHYEQAVQLRPDLAELQKRVALLQAELLRQQGDRRREDQGKR